MSPKKQTWAICRWPLLAKAARVCKTRVLFFLILPSLLAGCMGLVQGTTTSSSPQVNFSINPLSLNFGNVAVGSSASLSVAVTNSGTSDLNVSQVTLSGSAFTLTGLTAPMTLSPGQSTGFSVQFKPTTTGPVSGSVTIASNAPNSPLTVPMTGTGVQASSHFVDLSWVASSTANVTYNVYRGTVSGGPYLKVNSSIVPGTSYTDGGLMSGTTYFYVVTAVDANLDESVYSNQVSAAIP